VGAFLAERMDRYLVELDSGALFTRAGIDGVEGLVSAAHRLLILEQGDAEAFAGFAVDEHEHLCPFQPRRWVATFDLATDAADRLIDIRGIALERCDTCVHVFSSRSAAIGESTWWIYTARHRAPAICTSSSRSASKAARMNRHAQEATARAG